jgi:hypothetical protein
MPKGLFNLQAGIHGFPMVTSKCYPAGSTMPANGLVNDAKVSI